MSRKECFVSKTGFGETRREFQFATTKRFGQRAEEYEAGEHGAQERVLLARPKL